MEKASVQILSEHCLLPVSGQFKFQTLLKIIQKKISLSCKVSKTFLLHLPLMKRWLTYDLISVFGGLCWIEVWLPVSLFKIYLLLFCVYECFSCMCDKCLWRPQEDSGSPGTVTGSHLMGIEARSSTGTSSTLKCFTISPSLWLSASYTSILTWWCLAISHVPTQVL